MRLNRGHDYVLTDDKVAHRVIELIKEKYREFPKIKGYGRGGGFKIGS